MEVLQKYFNDRMWYQVLEYLDKGISLKESVAFIRNNSSVLVHKTHSLTLASILTKITDLNPDRDLLLQIKNEFDSIEVRNEEQEEALMLIKINLSILSVNLDGFELENEIYEYKKMENNKNIKKRLNKLLYLYYEKINDLEQGYSALKEYLEMNPENEDMKALSNKLANFALLSDEIYSFNSVLKYSEYLEHKDLIMAYNKGDIKYVLKNCKDFSIDKVYLIALLNICNSPGEFPLKEIGLKLDISDDAVFLLVLKALGKGLMKGMIDGENKILNIKKVVVREVTDEDISEMKESFRKWKENVRDVINSLV